MPKPTERSNRSEAGDRGRPNESQQSAQQDARDAAQPELAKATKGRESDGFTPTPEFQARLDEHSSAEDGPEGLRPTPEFQQRLGAHTSAKAEGNTAPQDPPCGQPSQDLRAPQRPQETATAQRSEDRGSGQRPQDSQAVTGEQAREHAVARHAAAAERAKATEDAVLAHEDATPRSTQEMDQPPLGNGQVQDPARAPQPSAGSRTDGQVKASSPDESAAVQQADEDTAQRGSSLDRDTRRQPAVDEEAAQRQPAVNENAQRQAAVEAGAPPRQTMVEESPQSQSDVDQDAAPDQDGVQLAAGEHESAAEERARPSAETTDETTPPEVTPNGNETGDKPLGPPQNGYTGPERRPQEAHHVDPADDLRVQPQTTPKDNTGTDRSAETAARLNELRNQGHGPQRHHDPTDEQLAARMGDPILDPRSGKPLLKDNGHVRARNKIDPMTGTTVDGVHGGVHRCGDYATRIDSPEDYVAADRYMREQIGDTGPASARRPIDEVLGPKAHERMTGYYHDPNAAGQLKPVDFTDGTVFAAYERLPNGDLNLRTMYVDPAPPNPDQLGGRG